MELKLFFPPNEIRQFFIDNGFQVIEKEFGTWDSAQHRPSKYRTWMEDVVIYECESVKASELFRSLAEIRLKGMIAPIGQDSRDAILMQLKKFLNHN